MSNEYQPDIRELIGAILHTIANSQNAEVMRSPPTINTMSDDEFLNMLDVVDELGNNVFHFSARRAPKAQMELAIEKLERLVPREKIRKILSTLSHSSHNMLQLATGQNESPDVHRILWNVIRKYFNSDEIMDMLKHGDPHGHNLLHFLAIHNTMEVIEVIWNETSRVFSTRKAEEFLDYLKSVNNYGENVLHLLMLRNDEKLLSFLWNKMKNVQQFKELFYQKSSREEKLLVLHYASLSGKIEFHVTLWDLMLNTFTKREDLVNLILQKSEHGDNFIHHIVDFNKPNIIEFTIKKIKEVFSDVQYKEILRSKGQMDRNLLHVATVGSKDIKTHQFLWKIFKDIHKPNILTKMNIFARPSCPENSETFLKLLTESSSQDSNIFHVAACFTTGEIFEFMLKELQKLATKEEIRTILGGLSLYNRNILQNAVGQNKSLSVQQQLWKVIHKYFNRSEIIKMMNHADESGYNLFICAAEVSTKEVVELTWNEICGIMSKTELTEYLKCSKNDGENIAHALMKTGDDKKLNYLWKKIESHFMSQPEVSSKSMGQTTPQLQIGSKRPFKELLHHKTTEKEASFLHIAAKSDKVEFHKVLWDLILHTFENREELKEFVMYKSNKGQRFLHTLIFLGKSDIIEYVLTKFKTVFSHNQFKEILNSHEEIANMNLHQVASIQLVDIKTHLFLWTLFWEYFNSSEMLEMVNHTDKEENNLLVHAALFSSQNIVKLTWNQIKVIYSKFGNTGLADYLISSNNNKETILHATVTKKDVKKFQYFWLEAKNNLTDQQFKDFILQKSSNDNQNILHRAAYCDNIEFHETLWELLLNTLVNREELKNFILDTTEQRNTFVSLLIIYNKADIIELTLKKIKENFTKIQQKEILTSNGDIDRNLIHCAAAGSEELKTHQILWQAIRDVCKSDEEYLQILKQTQSLNSNVLHFVILSLTEEIFRFMIEEMEKVASCDEMREILSHSGYLGANLLQLAAASKNQCLNFHGFLWKIIQKYFNTSEIADMMKHVDESGQNLLLLTVKFSSEDILKQTWDEIKIILDEHLVEYLRHVDKCGENIIHYLVQKEDIEKLRYFWEELENCFKTQNSPQSHHKLEFSTNSPQFDQNNSNFISNSTQFKELIMQESTESNKNILHFASYSEEVKLHETLWELLLRSVNQDELSNLIKQKNSNGQTLIHHLVAFNKMEVIDFSLQKIKQVLSDAQFREVITSSESQYQCNILQIASNKSKEAEEYRNFWKIIRKYTDLSTISEMLMHNNYEEDNLLLFDFKTNSPEIIMVTWNEIKAIARENSNFDMKEYLNRTNNNDANVLQILMKREHPDELKFFWTEFEKYFKTQKEFKEFISQKRSETDQIILHITAQSKNVEFLGTLWNVLLKTYSNREELMEFLMNRDFNNNTFLLYAITDIDSDMLTFMLKQLKENLNSDQFGDILKAKDGYNKNIIQRAAIGSKDLTKYQILIQNIQKTCKSNEDFLQFFTDEDHNGSNLIHITASTSSYEIFEFTIQSLEKIADHEKIRKILSSKGFGNTNLLQVATLANPSFDAHRYLWKIIKKYFNSSEILDTIHYNDDHFECNLWFFVMISPKLSEEPARLIWNEIQMVFNTLGENCAEKMLEYLKQINESEESILAYLIRDKHEMLEFHWTICENYFKTQNSSNLFKELIAQKSLSASENILHLVAKSDKIECHKIIWKLLLNTFENREELKNFILEKDKNGDNLFPNLFLNGQPDVIELTFERIKAALSDTQYHEIIKAKLKGGKNLLQAAACISKDLKAFKIVWQIIKNSCQSNEDFLEFLESPDDNGFNVFHDVAAFSSNESFFDFMTEEITKLTTNDKIRQLLSTLGSENVNLLQISAFCKKFEIYQNLWKIIPKYYDSFEILDMISHTDENGLSLLNYVSECDTKNIKELTIKEVNGILTSKQNFNEISNNLWYECEIILTKSENDTDTRDSLQLKWTEIVKTLKYQDSLEIHDKIANQFVLLSENHDQILKDYKTLHRMIHCDNLDVQKSSWKIVFDSFEDKKELMDLMLLEDVNGNNFAHCLVLSDNSEKIELIFQLIKENLDSNQFNDILRSKGQYGGNLLYIAALFSNNIKVHQVLWQIFHESFKTNFLDIFNEADGRNHNVLSIAARFASIEIIDFIFNQLDEFASIEEIREILRTTDITQRNLLQLVAEECRIPEAHSSLWNKIRKYFNSQEIIEFINYCDKDGDCLIHNAVRWNTKEIIDLTWKQIKTFITSKDDQIEYLKTTGYNQQNLNERSLDNETGDEDVKVWVNNLLSEYGIVFDSE